VKAGRERTEMVGDSMYIDGQKNEKYERHERYEKYEGVN